MDYLSKWLDRKVTDKSGAKIGRIFDLAAVMSDPLPEVTAVYIRCKDKQILAPLSALNPESFILSMENTQPYKLGAKDILLKKAMLDSQILDLNGKRVVRVNDVCFIWRQERLFIVGVEVGLLSLLRRLNLDGIALKLPKRIRRKLMARIIGWDQVEALSGAVRLNVPHEKIAQLHPADIADIMEQLDPAQRNQVFESLDVETAADTLEETEPEVSKAIIESLDVEKAADIVEEMEPDEAADLLGDLSDARAEELLEHMEAEEAADVKELLAYDEDTAGGMMTTEFVAVERKLTAQETIDRLRELHPEAETIYYVYVVDEQEQLVGVLSLRELIVSNPSTPISDIMETKVRCVNFNTSKNEVAELIGKYSFLAVPVTDIDNRLLGIITVDDTLFSLLESHRRKPHSSPKE